MPSSSQEIPSQPRVNCAWNRAGGIYGYRVVGFLSVPPATTCRSVGELLLCCIQHPTAPSLLEVFGPIFCASCFFLSKQFIMLVSLLPTCGHGHFVLSWGSCRVSQFHTAVSKYLLVLGSECQTNEEVLAGSFLWMHSRFPPLPFPCLGCRFKLLLDFSYNTADFSIFNLYEF